MTRPCFFFLLLFILYAGTTSARNGKDSLRPYHNAVYLELGGPTLIYALGYERTWYQTPRFAVMTAVGFSYIPDGITMEYIEPGVLFRDKNLAFELGLALGHYLERPPNGESFSTSGGSAEHIFMAPRAGVRFFSRNQRVHFRMGITPNIELSNNERGGSSERVAIFWLNVFTVGFRF